MPCFPTTIPLQMVFIHLVAKSKPPERLTFGLFLLKNASCALDDLSIVNCSTQEIQGGRAIWAN